ncbi:prepilin peptidase [Brevibacterium sp. UCMA 11754]|uniref:prepilin peptidase n=1 Tax=Brevibacterium sp. UCMA 11754 TaxID=2749198 RepID=UPI001F338FDA|nr:prepilin peptidase [Brevibacterium sp. UCMA 11754]MCF2571511.1 prepilin peptidase [Brevibacterium sp. UCMA 11754]
MDIGVLHGWPIGVSAVFSAGLGILLASSTSWWLADDAHAAVLAKTRLYRPLPSVILGIVLAAAAALLFPDAGVATDIGSVDRLLLALSLGAAAAATPYLAVVDIVVHRLPDRIVYPLIGIELLTFILGQLLGKSAIWALGLIVGGAGVLLFGVLYLSGRVMHARTMGLGDVKLAFVVFGVPSLFSPWAPALVFIIMMFIAGIAALLAAAAKRSLKATTIAFGPAMLSGMWFGSVLGPILL